MPAPSFSSRSALVMMLLLAIAWFGALDYRTLIKTDEARYAEIAREMVVSGDWITPRLNGIKYFEKPPLQYWMTALAFKNFGLHEWTARLWTALTGFLGVVLLWFTARRLFTPAVAANSALILASSPLYLGMSQMNTLDMGLCFFMQATLCCFLLAHFQADLDPRLRRRWMLLAWASMALAVLSKGLVGMILPGGVLTLYIFAARDWALLRKLEWSYGSLLFLLIAAPWFIAVSVINPEFAHFFFIHEHFERFLTKVHMRYEPWWYFLPVFAFGMLPWLGFVLQGLWQGLRPQGNAQQTLVARILLLWVTLIFVFFSLSDSKLASYILPIFPALALLIGLYLTRASVRALRWQMAIWCVLALALIAVLSQVGGNDTDVEVMRQAATDYRGWLYVALVIWIGGLALSYAWLRRPQFRPALLAFSVSAFLACLLAVLGHENLGRISSTKTLSAQIKPLLQADTPFYSIETFDHTLPFYLQHTVILVAHQNELAYGLQQEPERWIPTLDAFVQRWNSDTAPFAFMQPETYLKLATLSVPMKVVYEDHLRVVVTKP
ncbi:MAG: glycosyltransferase family 39 protein [Burkholderiaceae bacterium]|nr:MAG: glycosyltransferase family 39 protein [Burkholderiaceae bacterium]